ncbi:fluoride efflux transporter CrcB [Telmatocola sphagniphila]|jgi:CrcB protein|uniref:Fluoride-specific ion channel FluC n=1 Tax=Telmatocola sphagniphila TaxID=1123043 RepID=A0A8E6B6F7_9BACT|nr:fluoride efflux transporter CrcB [Telmatocola sphagniphila]QVL32757.1 fluoride efflux transporter CrcB [Telmatocola sphagniphila]
MQSILLVALGGMVGSIFRHLMAMGMRSWLGPTSFPWPIFSINVLGSATLGFITVNVRDRHSIWWFLLATGVCGGFTTFSAFSLEVFELIEQKRLAMAITYALASLHCGVLGFAVGAYLGLLNRGN